MKHDVALAWPMDELMMWYRAYGEAAGGEWDESTNWWKEADEK